ncbi:glycosyltransferase family 2 protein [Paraburkholderia caribensis]|uniref:glycosyltransferase family 2 protein n=1 Tax=Paraburkholderia caribensis TaxID=75105 RepID=UPI0028576683|nr:glycosyltransferase [Paraburkholderia caribensis]MDR6385443.1 GT2 family glycosyltransferase [Paraburkholderia caribensis]
MHVATTGEMMESVMELRTVDAMNELDAARVAIVIATKGRPDAIPNALAFLARQTLRPCVVILSATNEADIGEKYPTPFPVMRIFGPAGLPAQRNRALDALPADIDVVVFFDDDYAPCRDWIEQCVRMFESNPTVLGVSGNTVQDGSKGCPLTWGNASRIVADAESAESAPHALTPCISLYGCNMACRMNAMSGLHFDERLVLYGWLEDKDFSCRLASRGPIVRCAQMRGVHLGIASGRVSGKRFGYSQVVNPNYLRRKGEMSRSEAVRYIARALVMNALKSLRPEPHLDRQGRLIGNVLGLIAIVSGSGDPEQAAKL